MAPKRKSDTFDDELEYAGSSSSNKENASTSSSSKKQKVGDAGKPARGKKASEPVYASMHEVVLDGELDGDVPVYDDCNDIRRKIRALQKTPGFKITHWLRELGGIQSNSYQQFMKQTGPTGGAGNVTFRAAYIWFEKKRIFEGKPKTARRLEAEAMHPAGRELRTRNHQWVIVGRR